MDMITLNQRKTEEVTDLHNVLSGMSEKAESLNQTIIIVKGGINMRSAERQ